MADRTELLELALDSLTEGVALADQDGSVALWNRAAETITGFAGGEIVGHCVREMLDSLVVGGLSIGSDKRPRRERGGVDRWCGCGTK